MDNGEEEREGKKGRLIYRPSNLETPTKYRPTPLAAPCIIFCRRSDTCVIQTKYFYE